jgi:hypothetical protein
MELASAATMTPNSQACGEDVEEISPQGAARILFIVKSKRRDRRAVASRFIVASVNSFMGQATYDFAKHGFLHRFGCLFRRDPLDLALLLFWPLLALPPHSQWEDVHLAHRDATVLKALLIWK